ncbi:MAG: MBL fold metallo-hydrolase [Roseiflexus sp.]|nr:MBL fold metallo-hydrolase [Roseiflexus sp.]
MELRMRSVGPWPMNSYALVCPLTRHSVLIDPGAEPDELIAMLDGTTPVALLLTHTHPDHIGALDDMRNRLGVPVFAHAGPHASGVVLPVDRTLAHREVITVGASTISAWHTPGHTADMISYLVDSAPIAIVGDTLFDEGPGRTWSVEDFRTTLTTLRTVVLTWSDATICYPGHGPSFRLGDRRAAIERFLARASADFFGDATWDM